MQGLPHKKFFEVTLHLGDEKYVGQGSSLKEAKQLASSQAVTNTQFEKPAEKEKNTQNITPTVILNNIAFKLGIKVRYSMDGDGNVSFIFVSYFSQISVRYFQIILIMMFMGKKNIKII